MDTKKLLISAIIFMAFANIVIFRSDENYEDVEDHEYSSVSPVDAIAVFMDQVQDELSNEKKIFIKDIIKNPEVLNYLSNNDVLQYAYDIQKSTGVLVGTVIGQKGFESNWGRSTLCRETRNFSNIKCSLKSCKKYNKKRLKKRHRGTETPHCIQFYDDHPSDRFLKLKTDQDGWNAYKNLLLNSRYKMVRDAETMDRQAVALKLCGWATDRRYSQKIITIYDLNNLRTLQKYIDDGYIILDQKGHILLDPQ
jgi:uncharacterized FlgJ-related protein